MTKIIHKGDDFLSLQESIAEMAIKLGAVNFNPISTATSDTINCELKITVTKIKKQSKI